jgi:hypothetical protein
MLLINSTHSYKIKRHIDRCWFVAKDWNLPDMHFKEFDWDDEIDHQWHEFQAIEETNQAATTKMSVEEFIEGIR